MGLRTLPLQNTCVGLVHFNWTFIGLNQLDHSDNTYLFLPLFGGKEPSVADPSGAEIIKVEGKSSAIGQ